MSKTSGADLGGPWPRKGPPGSPGAPGDEKGMGKKLVTAPGPDSAVLGGSRPQNTPKKIKSLKNFGTGTGQEIVEPSVSGALRARMGTEKRGEEDGAGPGPGFGRFGT